MNQKAKRVLNKLLVRHLCPHCNKPFADNEIGWAEEGTDYFEVNLSGKGNYADLNYEEDEFEQSGEGWFYCRGCGEELDFTSDQVIEILKDIEYEEKRAESKIKI